RIDQAGGPDATQFKQKDSLLVEPLPLFVVQRGSQIPPALCLCGSIDPNWRPNIPRRLYFLQGSNGGAWGVVSQSGPYPLYWH
ncbi:hypothetical protein, partial [Salinibacter ruber]|uniref:hypothetical protein n=1 Tax=Salinibacter ruber TaxID=146919 RepID=UPI002073C0A2